ncbi:hypothetical protein DPMN_032403 [Dreissena polymorpha]|uniref:Uncharacterized protein n=1 Tax=Dreissena polymorpha TaxID=45954 RepID=A0A9D4M1S4_DREPO|nr:hypothetical protein DPMN_032403 [Dreissena polymorpha]
MKSYFVKTKKAPLFNDPFLFEPTVANISEQNSHLLLVVDEQGAEMTVDTDRALAFLRGRTIRVDVIQLPATSGKTSGNHPTYRLVLRKLRITRKRRFRKPSVIT